MGRSSKTSKASATGHRSASIQDVAKAAAVSITTVSRVINNPDLVSASTAERVRKVVQELGYRPNVFARGLMTKRSRMIGLMLPPIAGKPFVSLLSGADEEAKRRGYHLLVSSNSESEPRESFPYDFLDGVVVMPTEPGAIPWEQARELDLPVCVLDAEVDDPGVDNVVVDYEIGVHQATEHLLRGTPPGRCFFVGGSSERQDMRRRADEFVRTLAGKGHRVTDDQVVFDRPDSESAMEWAKRMHGQDRLKGSTILAGSDEIAFGILMAAQEKGLAQPADVKIVGFGDTPICTLVRPMLSTVHLPLQKLGAMAIELLVDRLDEPDGPRVVRRLGTTLIIRETSG